MEAFSHSGIDLDGSAIRLLRLLKGTEPNVECEIFQASLDTIGNDAIPYEALSYTWGDMIISATVQINAKSHAITENLYFALRHLRLRDEDRIIWVDALCIDQSNLEERGHQVGQMGKVYSQAQRVLFWLGPGTDETDLLMDSLQQLERLSKRNWALSDHRWSDTWYILQSGLKFQHPKLESQQEAGLQLLLSRPWFERVWILQEVANAQRAAVCSGTKSISAHVFVLAPRLMTVDVEPQCQVVLDIMPGQSRRNSWWSTKRDLYTLLRNFSNSKASDPRDNIYALLGISSDGGGLDADYTKTLDQVIHDTVIFLFNLPANAERYTISDWIPRVISHNSQPLEAVVRSNNVNWIDAFIRSRTEEVGITPELFLATAENTLWGHVIVRYLLGNPHVHIHMSRELLLAAIKTDLNGADIETMILLHQRCGEEMVICTAECEAHYMAALLDKRGKNVQVTAAVLQAAEDNHMARPQMTYLLMKQYTRYMPIDDVVEVAVFATKSGLKLLAHIQTQQSNMTRTTALSMVNLAFHTQNVEAWTLLFDDWQQGVAPVPKQSTEALNQLPTDFISLFDKLDRYGKRKLFMATVAVNQLKSLTATENVIIERDMWESLLEQLEGDERMARSILELLTPEFQRTAKTPNLLIKQPNYRILITEKVMITATSETTPPAMLNIRLKHSEDPITEWQIRKNIYGYTANRFTWQHVGQGGITNDVIDAMLSTSSLDHTVPHCFSVQRMMTLEIPMEAFRIAKHVKRALIGALWREKQNQDGRTAYWASKKDPIRLDPMTRPTRVETDVELHSRDRRLGISDWRLDSDREWHSWLSGFINPTLESLWAGIHDEMMPMRNIFDHPKMDTRYIRRPYGDWKIFAKRLRAAFQLDVTKDFRLCNRNHQELRGSSPSQLLFALAMASPPAYHLRNLPLPESLSSYNAFASVVEPTGIAALPSTSQLLEIKTKDKERVTLLPYE